ncbi:uncharacterized protein LOC122276582 isoform X2 [Carya illinoinensis]|uniref:uncharacterized protein LOC122276582 isoform X2 n=1 Tax=Carya illinoinensis TaxID=32201 RepID=UPI001C7183B0|nr:uncharacterized protein LOC122276582 isoform X2 [Carya illinoinensis]
MFFLKRRCFTHPPPPKTDPTAQNTHSKFFHIPSPAYVLPPPLRRKPSKVQLHIEDREELDQVRKCIAASTSATALKDHGIDYSYSEKSKFAIFRSWKLPYLAELLSYSFRTHNAIRSRWPASELIKKLGRSASTGRGENSDKRKCTSEEEG